MYFSSFTRENDVHAPLSLSSSLQKRIHRQASKSDNRSKRLKKETRNKTTDGLDNGAVDKLTISSPLEADSLFDEPEGAWSPVMSGALQDAEMIQERVQEASSSKDGDLLDK